MRVTFVVSTLGAGGTERFATILAAGISDTGHIVTVVSVHSSDGDAYLLPDAICRVRLEIDRPRAYRWLIGPRSRLASVREVRRSILATQADVVVALGWSLNVLTVLSTLFTKSRVVVCERSDPRQHKVGRVWRLIQRVTYPLARHLVVQTEAARGVVGRWVLPSRLSVIPNPLERDAFRITASPGLTPIVAAVGRLADEKGFDTLIAAFDRVRSRVPRAELVLVGDGPSRVGLEKLVRDLGLGGMVQFVGWQSRPAAYVGSAWCYCLTSRREGFPNALIEAMALGVPVVATDCRSGPSEIIVPGSGILVPVDDVDHLADAITLVLTDRVLAASMASQALRRARDFEHDVIIARWLQCLTAAARRHR